MIYEFAVVLPLGKLLNPVKELEESINASLDRDGFDQKLSIGYTQKGTMKVEREMTETEIKQMMKIIHDQFEQSFGSAQIEYFRRQSGNVQLSAS